MKRNARISYRSREAQVMALEQVRMHLHAQLQQLQSSGTLGGEASAGPNGVSSSLQYARSVTRLQHDLAQVDRQMVQLQVDLNESKSQCRFLETEVRNRVGKMEEAYSSPGKASGPAKDARQTPPGPAHSPEGRAEDAARRLWDAERERQLSNAQAVCSQQERRIAHSIEEKRQMEQQIEALQAELAAVERAVTSELMSTAQLPAETASKLREAQAHATRNETARETQSASEGTPMREEELGNHHSCAVRMRAMQQALKQSHEETEIVKSQLKAYQEEVTEIAITAVESIHSPGGIASSGHATPKAMLPVASARTAACPGPSQSPKAFRALTTSVQTQSAEMKRLRKICNEQDEANEILRRKVRLGLRYVSTHRDHP
ncbi:hypothetical protein CYMTET_17220 [Cymbomonas tetramitiformis]|uniref:Uncharacterized protein n=1 Tax=Cymbomonas tetramitiformis TaxID=36881 RepID=A0AAE0L764_9CHLO|nr:hypothetical protein CYMTET_17220 [Cymbomonas tetramitiformis]